MKLSEEMDMDNGSIPADAMKIKSPSHLTSDNSLKPHLPTQNGIKHPAENVSNGNTSLDNSPEATLDENAIGFEVESYSDFNTSLSHGSFSQIKGDSGSVELNGNNHSSNDGDNRENSNKIFSDESCTESTHNSSHLSEEFQLRLSDDDSNQLAEAVSSSTPFQSVADVTKDEDGTILAGSKSIESTSLARDLLVKNVSLDLKPNKDNEVDVHLFKCTGEESLETPCKDSQGEPKVQDNSEVKKVNTPNCTGHDVANEEGSHSTDVESQTTDVLKGSDDSMPSSSQPENCTKKLLSLEDTLEAELEAELQAEIAAEMENKDKIEANQKNDSVHGMCTTIPSERDSDEKDLSSTTTQPCSLVISVIKTEKEDEDKGEYLSIKEEVLLKSEEMFLDCDDLPIKKEIKIEPLALKSEESHVKSEPIAPKCEPLKSEDCPVKTEGNLDGSRTQTLKSEFQPVATISSVMSVKSDDSLPPCGDTSNKSEAPVAASSQDSSEVRGLDAMSREQAESEANKEDATSSQDSSEVRGLDAVSREQAESEANKEDGTSSQDSSEVRRLDAVSREQAESGANKEDVGEAQEEPNKIVENNISSQQQETPQSLNFPDEESRSHESDQNVSNEEEEIQSKNLDAYSASLSEPNSPFSDESDCPVSDIHVESDDVSVNGDGLLNENDSDTMCDNDTMMTDEVESSEKMDTDRAKTPAVENVSSSNLNDMNLSESSNFCDSTVLDTSCTGDIVSQDRSNSANENNATKGFRKRFLSHSEDDSCDTFRNKKSNGLLESEEKSENRKSFNETSHKRPAEHAPDIDSKKQCFSRKDLAKQPEDETEKEQSQTEMSNENCPTQTKENLEDSTFEPLEESDKSLDLAGPTDLPFLRKMHKRQFSKMSRSDLEELILQKMCEAITERSLVGELRIRCQALEIRQEKENEKFNKLKKQMTELSIVMRKYMDNQRLHKPTPPIRVTRSVGLQVCPAVKLCSPSCFSSIRTRGCQQAGQAINQNWPPKQSVTPSKPDSSLPDTPSQVQQAKQVTPNKGSPRPATNIVSSTVPPALVPTGSSNSTVLLMPGRAVMTPPRVQVPPLQQISTIRPRFSIPTSIAATPPPPVIPTQQISPVRHSSPQSTTQQKAAGSTDVEVIDIENEDHSKRSAGLQISPQQHQHQQKQAANAAAQSLAGNSGMTVRLISPTQATIPTGYSNFLVPAQGNMPQKMIIASPPPGNGIRGNFKFVMKSSQGNVIIPIQSNGAAVSSSVVQIPASAAVQQIFTNAGAGKRTNTIAPARPNSLVHPAPLPVGPPLQAQNPAWKQIPPRPNLKIQHQNNGIVLSWNMALGSQYADIESYQLFAYQEGAAPPNPGLWKKVGDVKALPLPMACTLTQFVEGHRYHFTVRAVDKHGRVGPFSQQGSIRLGN
ncbi:uncharacterized protein LOC117641950 isoform X2 [Thrips palmi]|uniref:Uncharacterized protein LOC117641950 isoform X2 n=1 Tax=Thrips palmi TaxID=161013 RepID=A0A6P8Y7H5_THRPL|nr:uncharacterized protein LOC117641950 isoform X2 [Thrips palmi]